MSKRVCQRCPVCDEFFTDEVNLTTHVNTHFEDECKDKQSGIECIFLQVVIV